MSDTNQPTQFLTWMADGVAYLTSWQPNTGHHPILTLGTFTFVRADDFPNTWADQPKSLTVAHGLVDAMGGLQRAADVLLQQHHFSHRMATAA